MTGWSEPQTSPYYRVTRTSPRQAFGWDDCMVTVGGVVQVIDDCDDAHSVRWCSEGQHHATFAADQNDEDARLICGICGVLADGSDW